MAHNNNPFYVDPGNDYSAGLSGLSNTLLNVRQQQLQNAELQRRQEKEDRANQRFQEVQAAAMKAFESKDPDFIAKTAVQYPEITPMLKEATGLKDEVQNRDALDFTRAFATASPEQIPALYERRIKQIQDRGGDASNTIQSYQDYQQNPEAEKRDVISYWAGIDPKGYSVYSDEQKAAAKAAADKRTADLQQARLDQQANQFNRAEAGRNQRAYARAQATAGATNAQKQTAHMQDFAYYQELKKTDPEAAAQFGQAAGFVSKEGRELSPQAQKRLSVAIDDTVTAERNVGKFEQLATDIEASDFTPGVAGTLGEKFKELTGEQDAVSNLRREYNAIKGSQVVNNLPPGAASDKDIELAMAGFPTDRANKQQIASFMRGLAKVQRLNAEFSGFKADYISDNGSERGMLQAWKDQGRSAPKSPDQSSQGQPPSVTTQAQFDALPSGAVYMEDGQQYRKP